MKPGNMEDQQYVSEVELTELLMQEHGKGGTLPGFLAITNRSETRFV